jgi:hypothetical protein
MPQHYNVLTLPSATNFNSGGNDIKSSGTLSPGSYGNVTLGTSKTLNLSSGDYYFKSFSMSGSGKLKINLNTGKIRIFITGNTTFGTSIETTILNGSPENVYWEIHGNFNMGGSGKWNGIIYCPSGNITIGTSCIIKGALWAGGDISIGGSSMIYYMANSLNKDPEDSENIEQILNIVPSKYVLDQNYPNPFNPSTKIRFQLPEKNHVSLKIYDILGNLITTLVDQEMEAGYYDFDWNAGNLSSGIYLYTLQSGSYFSTKKLMLVK